MASKYGQQKDGNMNNLFRQLASSQAPGYNSEGIPNPMAQQAYAGEEFSKNLTTTLLCFSKL